MTVYSINKRLFDQANMSVASNAKTTAPSAEAAFSQLLQSKTSLRLGDGAMPSATTALKESFDKSATETRDRAPERDDRRGEAVTRKSDNRSARTERRHEDKPAEKAERPEARATEKGKTDDAPKAEKPAEAKTAEAAAEAPAETKTGETATETVTVDPAAQTQAQAQTQADAVVDAVATQMVAPSATQAGTDDSSAEVTAENPDQDPFAWLDNQFGDDIADLEGQIDSGDVTDEDALAAQAALAAQSQTSTTATTTQAAQTSAAKPAEIASDLAKQQADELAASLEGTDANLQVAVTVTADDDAATVDAVDATAGEGESPLDLLLGRTLGERPAGGQGAGNPGQGANGQPNQGTANAAQQVQANAALANAQAAQGRATEAKPFAAALAAQVEASGATQGASSANQGPAVAGLNAANGTSAAQKATQPQAAHAQQQARQPDPKQVIDQISVQITKQTKDGGDTIKVQLKPVDLGRIEIKLEVQDGKVMAHVSADNKDTLALLQKDASGLEKALRDAGLKTEQGSMTFSLANDGQQAQQNGDAANRGGRRSRRLAAAAAAEQASGAASASPVRTGGRSGVDIQV